MNEQDISTQILSDITVYMKYARYLPEQKRRETWEELVTRNMEMHLKKYPELKKEIKEIESHWKLITREEIHKHFQSPEFKPAEPYKLEWIVTEDTMTPSLSVVAKQYILREAASAKSTIFITWVNKNNT